MEEKWWKKFQSKDEELIAREKELKESTTQTHENPKNDGQDYKFEEQTNDENKKINSKEIFSDAINFIQDLGDSIGKTIIDETKKIPDNEELNNIIHDINDKAKNTAEQIATKTSEFINSKEVSDAAFKAKEVMKDVVSEVKSWTSETKTPHDLNEEQSKEVLKDEGEQCPSDKDLHEERNEECECSLKCKNEDYKIVQNPIMEDMEAIKDKVNATINSKEVQNAVEYACGVYDDVMDFAKNTLNEPSIEKGLEKVSETINETLENPHIKPAVENLKHTSEDVKKWVFEVANNVEVQNNLNHVLTNYKVASDKVNEELDKIVRNPKVTTYYTNSKDAIVTSANKVNKSIKETVGPIVIDESLKEDAIEWGETALKLTKQSANLIVKSAVEIKNSAQVKKAIAYSKKTSKALFKLGMQTLNNKTNPTRISNNEIKHITINEEHDDSHEEE